MTNVASHRDEHRLREQIAEFGKSMFDRGLTAGSSGNISVRLDDAQVADVRATFGHDN